MSRERRTLEPIAFKACISESANYLKSLRGYIARKSAQHEFQMVLGELIRRMALHVMAIDRIADDFIRDLGFKQPIFVLLRTLATDAILAMYLTDEIEVKKSTSDTDVSISEDDKEKFRKRYEKHKWRSLKNAKQQFDYLKSVREHTQDDLDKVVEGWKRNNPFLFTDNGELKPNSAYKDVAESIKDMVEGITNATNQTSAKDLYYFYFLFSQHEHFSEATKNLMNSEELDYIDFERVIKCLYAILSLYLKNLLAYLNLENKSYEAGLDDLIESVGNKIKNGITIAY